MLKTKAICGPADRIGTTWSPMRSAPASRILYMAARRQITTFNRRSPRCWTLSRQGYCRCNSIDQPVYRSPRRNTNKKRVLKRRWWSIHQSHLGSDVTGGRIGEVRDNQEFYSCAKEQTFQTVTFVVVVVHLIFGENVLPHTYFSHMAVPCQCVCVS